MLSIQFLKNGFFILLSFFFLSCGGGGSSSENAETDVETAPSDVEVSEEVPTLILDKNISMNENESISIYVDLKVDVIETVEPKHGTLSRVKNTITYIPTQSFNGIDTFSYKYSDELDNQNSAKVEIVIKDFILSSSSYSEGSKIPNSHVCSSYNGANLSPQFSWKNAPKETKSYALIMDDEISPCGINENACKHWGLFNIPSSTLELEENLNVSSMSSLVEGLNYNGTRDYEGPCPPNVHTYKTTVYALDELMPSLNTANMTRSQFQAKYSDNILNSAIIRGIFP